jgi:hypothetical protein
VNKLIIAILIIFSVHNYSQIDSTIWNDVKQVKADDYSFYVPSKWKDLDMKSYGMLHYYEASGLAFPISFNGGPVIVILSFVRMENKNSLEEVKESIQRGYSENKDRVFPENFNYETEEFILKSSEKAWLINTRFFRTSKNLNQSRFDLGIYSEKSGNAYMYTISIQYSDDTYKFEKDYKLKDFARKVYSYFSLN